MSKERKAQARPIIHKICRINKRPLDPADAFVDSFTLGREERGGGLVDLFRLPATRRNTLLMSFCWLAFSMGYFGLFYNTPSFNWDPFVVFMFPAFLVMVVDECSCI
jgi:hypothetical protein